MRSAQCCINRVRSDIADRGHKCRERGVRLLLAVASDGQRELLARESGVEPEPLRLFGRHDEIKAAAVAHLVLPGPGFRRLDRLVAELVARSHVLALVLVKLENPKS